MLVIKIENLFKDVGQNTETGLEKKCYSLVSQFLPWILFFDALDKNV